MNSALICNLLPSDDTMNRYNDTLISLIGLINFLIMQANTKHEKVSIPISLENKSLQDNKEITTG